jgi:hypothetical protein
LRVGDGDLRHRIRKVANDPLLNAIVEGGRRGVSGSERRRWEGIEGKRKQGEDEEKT